MKKSKFYIFICVICIFSFLPIVMAEDVESTDSCDAIALNELIKKASKVTGTYEFVYNENNEVIGFNYLIYNIPENMYVVYSGIGSQKAGAYSDSALLELDPDTRIGKVFDDNIVDTYSVSFFVYSSDSGCGSILKTITIKKLRYNPISKIEQCKYDGLEDYLYCKEWVDTTFPFGEAEIIKKIESKKDKEKSKTTGVCLFCEENKKNEAKYNTLVLIKQVIMFGLISGIIIDVVIIIYLFRKVGESRI